MKIDESLAADKLLIWESELPMFENFDPKEPYQSDLIRVEIIEEFFKAVEKDPDHNIDDPDFEMLLDINEGYKWQTYIQNDLKNGNIIYWEGWTKECWKGVYAKPEYKGLKKPDAIKKVISERMPEIAKPFNMKIMDSNYFFHEMMADYVDDGYIMSVTMHKTTA